MNGLFQIKKLTKNTINKKPKLESPQPALRRANAGDNQQRDENVKPACLTEAHAGHDAQDDLSRFHESNLS
ncbi:MAG: hypothetical protein H8E27_15020 [Verrucomicrobia subdivision 3 bacterium]|nr:hypothetical protein [Limisphaerales bacterium]